MSKIRKTKRKLITVSKHSPFDLRITLEILSYFPILTGLGKKKSIALLYGHEQCAQGCSFLKVSTIVSVKGSGLPSPDWPPTEGPSEAEAQ